MDNFDNDIEDLLKGLPWEMRSGQIIADVHSQGKRTIISNYVQISNQLQRDKDHLRKFLSNNLGMSCKLKDRQLHINSVISQTKLQELLDKYVEIYVICPNCGKPDTVLHLKKRKAILACLACGEKSSI